MKDYISVNLVSRALILVRCIRDHRCCRISEVGQLMLPYGVDRSASLAFARQCGWISGAGDDLAFTGAGEEIAEMFDGVQIGAELWRKILRQYISVCRPAWAKRIPYGRMEAFLFMNEEEQRCFTEAGLMDGQEEEVLAWWDAAAGRQRLRKNAALDDIGRRGERLTMAYEKARTGVRPDWRSIETNCSGYDILSQRSPEDGSRLLIEVKASSQPPETAWAVISRHEWEVASLANNRGRYLFYLWELGRAAERLAIITVEEMGRHIPADRRRGVWESVRVPFAAFAGSFSQPPPFPVL